MSIASRVQKMMDETRVMMMGLVGTGSMANLTLTATVSSFIWVEFWFVRSDNLNYLDKAGTSLLVVNSPELFEGLSAKKHLVLVSFWQFTRIFVYNESRITND